MSEVTTHEIEVEGKTYVVQRRWHTIGPPDNPTDQVKEYSMDSGETWHLTLPEAFSAARDAGKLTVFGEALTTDGEFETWLLSLATAVVELGVGERLILLRTETQVVVVKEQALSAIRASTIRDAELKLTEGK